jgi:hypothetical protein
MAMRALLLLFFAPALARAAPTVRLRVDGHCPSAAQLADRLGQVAQIHLADNGVLIDVQDRGDRYNVSLLGLEREIADPGHLCSDRAAAAALHIAMTLVPPDLTPQMPTGEPVSVRKRAETRRSFFANGQMVVEAGFGAQVAPQNRDVLAAAFDVRTALGSRWIQFLVGAAVSTPGHASLMGGMGDATVLRAPFDLGLRLSARRGHVEGALDVSAYLGVLDIHGSGFAHPLESLRLDSGVRIAPALRVWVHPKVALAAVLPIAVAFRTYELAVDNQGTVGETPRVWLSPMLGISAKCL